MWGSECLNLSLNVFNTFDFRMWSYYYVKVVLFIKMNALEQVFQYIDILAYQEIYHGAL